ncbi:MAG: hypothetical protein IKL85_07060 [Lentisphaeria bacterium]|nr:hypothetical protein [Lentisphaeria bacterium]
MSGKNPFAADKRHSDPVRLQPVHQQNAFRRRPFGKDRIEKLTEIGKLFVHEHHGNGAIGGFRYFIGKQRQRFKIRFLKHSARIIHGDIVRWHFELFRSCRYRTEKKRQKQDNGEKAGKEECKTSESRKSDFYAWNVNGVILHHEVSYIWNTIYYTSSLHCFQASVVPPRRPERHREAISCVRCGIRRGKRITRQGCRAVAVPRNAMDCVEARSEAACRLTWMFAFLCFPLDFSLNPLYFSSWRLQ